MRNNALNSAFQRGATKTRETGEKKDNQQTHICNSALEAEVMHHSNSPNKLKQDVAHTQRIFNYSQLCCLCMWSLHGHPTVR